MMTGEQANQLGIVRIEHIGIAIDRIDLIEQYEMLLGTRCYKSEDVPSEQVRTHFLQIGETKMELLQGLSQPNAIDTFIRKRGIGIHHIALEVEDIHRAFAIAQEMGLEILNDQPKPGADNKLIFFVHPKSTGGILLEFCQSIVL